MKIAYYGSFLAEGLRGLGHEVIPLPLAKRCSLQSIIQATCPDAELVLLEVFGGNTPFTYMAECKQRLALYCIDSSINEFWLKHLAQLADDVFVDQRSSVAALASEGISTQWLPLCVDEANFRNPRKLEHEVSFVGTVNASRLKRANLLRLIEKHFSLHLQTSVSVAEMLNIFAASKASINENLFPGLTLRMLQCMAAGTILFTEADNPDVTLLFEDGKELIFYNPNTLLPRLKDVLDNYQSYQHIARSGQEACRAKHTSLIRAREFLQLLEERTAYNERRAEPERLLASASAEFLYSVRFGGPLGNARNIFMELTKNAALGITAKATLLLGDMAARLNNPEKALAWYALAAKSGNAEAELKIKTIQSLTAEPSEAKAAAQLLATAKQYLARGKVAELGFITPDADHIPATALALASKAWELHNDVASLDFMLECAKEAGVELEMLPTLLSAIHSLCAEKHHLRYAAELAHKSYDAELEKTLLAGL